MRAIGNFLWFILGGALMGLAWWLVGVVAFMSIVGIPWGKACFVIGQFSFFPFGKEAISRKELKQTDDIGTGALGTFGNVIWFVSPESGWRSGTCSGPSDALSPSSEFHSGFSI